MDNELNGALSSAKQFICSVTGLPLPPLASSGLGDYQVEILPWEQYVCPSLVLRHLRARLYSLELSPSFSHFLSAHMTLVRKIVGDREV